MVRLRMLAVAGALLLLAPVGAWADSGEVAAGITGLVVAEPTRGWPPADGARAGARATRTSCP